MRNKVIYQSEKGYQAISKGLWLQQTTVRAICTIWRKHGTVVNLPRTIQPTEITPRAHQQPRQKASSKAKTTADQKDHKGPSHIWDDSNQAELEQFGKEEWGKIPPQWCERLIASYDKHLIAVVSVKDGTTSY